MIRALFILSLISLLGCGKKTATIVMSPPEGTPLGKNNQNTTVFIQLQEPDQNVILEIRGSMPPNWQCMSGQGSASCSMRNQYGYSGNSYGMISYNLAVIAKRDDQILDFRVLELWDQMPNQVQVPQIQ